MVFNRRYRTIFIKHEVVGSDGQLEFITGRTLCSMGISFYRPIFQMLKFNLLFCYTTSIGCHWHHRATRIQYKKIAGGSRFKIPKRLDVKSFVAFLYESIEKFAIDCETNVAATINFVTLKGNFTFRVGGGDTLRGLYL